MKNSLFYMLCLALLISVMPTLAQDTPKPVPEAAEVEAADGLVLKGDLYRPDTIPEGGAPALLLMHQYQSSRAGYKAVIPEFVAAGYIVLAVDLRGHGATGGKNDWVAAQTDTQMWLAWLREQEGVSDNKVAIIGASIGSNLALVGCAQDPDCVTVIALSPGLDYFGVQPKDFVVNDLATRSALLIAGSRDRESADTIRSIFTAARGRVGAEMFPSGLHGTAFFGVSRDREATMAIILPWLEQAFAGVRE
jgi:pimeloyl-ACP methyl ester carboxylesterase